MRHRELDVMSDIPGGGWTGERRSEAAELHRVRSRGGAVLPSSYGLVATAPETRSDFDDNPPTRFHGGTCL